MSKNVNRSQPYRLYDKPTRTWFEVPADVYESYTRECNTHRKKIGAIMEHYDNPATQAEYVYSLLNSEVV